MPARVLIDARYWADRLSQPRTRADEAREIRLRLAEQVGPDQVSAEEARIALQLRRMRERLCSLFGVPRACQRCALPPYAVFRGRSGRGRSVRADLDTPASARTPLWPRPAAVRHSAERAAWLGGHCCSGPTRNLFTDEELAALRLSGTTPGVLKLPRGAHAGCAFRGPLGCSLDAAHRPSLCVRYTCRELESELDEEPSRSAVRQLQRQLGTLFDRFVQVRRARLDHEDLSELFGHET